MIPENRTLWARKAPASSNAFCRRTRQSGIVEIKMGSMTAVKTRAAKMTSGSRGLQAESQSSGQHCAGRSNPTSQLGSPHFRPA
eukprot:4370498-Pleurochrysis_carterae.AAC.1